MIIKSTLGIHNDVVIAEFGTGDIKFTRARFIDDENETLLLFHNAQPGEIGRTTLEDEGLTTDELAKPEFVLRFTKPESITALIHSLIELQYEVIKQQKPCLAQLAPL